MKSGWAATVLFVSSLVTSTLSAQQAVLINANRPSEHSGESKPVSGMPKLKIVIYDFAHLDRSLLIEAEKVATDIFKESGVETEWFDCGASRECDLQAQGVEFRLIIQPQAENVVKDNSQARDLAKTYTLGFAIPCNMNDMACLFYIFYSPINSLASQFGARTTCVLGQVMVHEIGHALLDPDANSRAGIMQPKFSIQAMDRFLYFSARESKRLRAQLSIRNEVVKNRLTEDTKAIADFAIRLQ